MTLMNIFAHIDNISYKSIRGKLRGILPGEIYKGKPVDSESITSVQVSIWNAGTRSIRGSDVLDPFRLVMPDGAPILSVRVKKTSRPICGFENLDNKEDYKSGTCRLKWLILEPGDGVVLQIIYAGSARRDPTLKGIVEGQKDGVVVEQYNLTLDRTAISPSSISVTRLGASASLMLVSGLLLFIAIRISARTEAAKKICRSKGRSREKLGRTTEEDSASTTSLLGTLCGCVYLSFLCLVYIHLGRAYWSAIRLVGNGQGERKRENSENEKATSIIVFA
jgi:hypothetical protein